ncbi:hypothetical protein FBU30_010537 [Linnemannia zychae]|nr:hypothetical protein FBU30_010537 [Linnemannia zychae]
MAQAGRYGGSSGTSGYGGGLMGTSPMNAGGIPAPIKKKDPYATAWRTYSKIAEELQLLNPDGSLYPISKEAILKYLHHQSKRIKSSNLHWYVNGLKKHQENLGFPWDDVRYDEEVVGLLKELTLHPVMMNEAGGGNSGHGGDDDGHFGYGPNRQRQVSSGIYPLGSGVGSGRTGGHHYSSSSIDTTRIANLTISQPSPQQHQQQQQQQQNSQSFVNVGLKQHHQNHNQFLQQQQQAYQNSQRIQQPPPPKPYYHSAPIQQSPSSSSSSTVPSLHTRTPSSQELANLNNSGASSGGMHQMRSGHQQQSPSSSLGMSHALRSEPTLGSSAAHSGSALSKRKRDDFAFKKHIGRMPSSMSIEGDDHDEEDLQDDYYKEDDEDDLEMRRGTSHYHSSRQQYPDPDDSDEMEDSNRYQPLKRRASTGTLLNQAQASVVKHVPGPFTTDTHQESSIVGQSATSQDNQKTLHHRVSSSGLSSSSSEHNNTSSQNRTSHHSHRRQDSQQHPNRSLSPEFRDAQHHYSKNHRECDTAPHPGEQDLSVESAVSVHQRQHSSLIESSDSQRFRHVPPSINTDNSGHGINTMSGTTMSASGSHRALEGASTPTPAPISTSTSTGKTTVQFSDVVECAQLLQAKYGHRCKEHPWGCVEITPDRHLELTIKMYLDWAGLVASERLTMEELPDLPDFRDIHPRPLRGGTLKRMASTPFSSSRSTIVRGERTNPIDQPSFSTPSMISATNTTLTGSGNRDSPSEGPTTPTRSSYFGPYRSPFSSPQNHATNATTNPHDEKGDPMTDDGPNSRLVERTRMSTASPPPHSIQRPASSMARRPRPSTPDIGTNSSSSATEGKIPLLGRARKMPSTPSLRQVHQKQHEFTDRYRHQLFRQDITRIGHSQPPPQSSSARQPTLSTTVRGRSNTTVSNSSAFSGPSEDEDILLSEDDEPEDVDDEEDEELKMNHYALSPWVSAPPSVIEGARLRGSRNMGPMHHFNSITSATPTSSITDDRSDSVNENENTKRHVSEMGSGSHDEISETDGNEGEQKNQTNTMMLDPERSILQIGELASPHQYHDSDTDAKHEDEGDGHVEAATYVLDSMVIGQDHTEDMDIDEIMPMAPETEILMQDGVGEMPSLRSNVVNAQKEKETQKEGLERLLPQLNQKEKGGDATEEMRKDSMTMIKMATEGNNLTDSQNQKSIYQQQQQSPPLSVPIGSNIIEAQLQTQHQYLEHCSEKLTASTMSIMTTTTLVQPSSDSNQNMDN